MQAEERRFGYGTDAEKLYWDVLWHIPRYLSYQAIAQIATYLKSYKSNNKEIQNEVAWFAKELDDKLLDHVDKEHFLSNRICVENESN